MIVKNEGPDPDYQVFYKLNRALPLDHLSDIYFFLNGRFNPDDESGNLAHVRIVVALGGREDELRATVPFRHDLPATFVRGVRYFRAIGCTAR